MTYTGTESTAAAAPTGVTPEVKLRRELETLHAEGTDPEAVAKAWPYLGHKDRYVRWSASGS